MLEAVLVQFCGSLRVAVSASKIGYCGTPGSGAIVKDFSYLT